MAGRGRWNSEGLERREDEPEVEEAGEWQRSGMSSPTVALAFNSRLSKSLRQSTSGSKQSRRAMDDGLLLCGLVPTVLDRAGIEKTVGNPLAAEASSAEAQRERISPHTALGVDRLRT